MHKILALTIALSLPATLASAGWAPAGKALNGLTARAKAVGEDSANQALAALYNRLFQLQDLRREAEMKIEISELTIQDSLLPYKKLDRYVDTIEELKEIAADPEHRRYPNITETAKLKILENVRVELRKQRLAELRITKIERDIAAVEELIGKYLERSTASARK